VLAMVVVIGLMVGMTMLVKDKTVASSGTTAASLDDLFDDGSLAKDGIEALRAAGLIDENGKMVDLEIRENGKDVELASLATRIASGDEVGEITVNGNAVTTDKIMQLQQVSSSLDVIDLMDKDVEITDEHVANLQVLLEDIALGKVNLAPLITAGAQQVTMNRGGELEEPHFQEKLVSLLYDEAWRFGKSFDEIMEGLNAFYYAGYIDADGNPLELDPSLGAEKINRIDKALEILRIFIRYDFRELIIPDENRSAFIALIENVTNVKLFATCYVDLLGKSEEEAIAAWDTLWDLGLLDANGSIATFDTNGYADAIDRVNQGLEVISLILAGRKDEVTEDHLIAFDSMLSDIASGEIDLTDVFPGPTADMRARVNSLASGYKTYLGKDRKDAKAAFATLKAVGLIDDDANLVELSGNAAKIERVNLGLEALSLIIDGRDDEITKEQVVSFDTLVYEIKVGYTDVYDIVPYDEEGSVPEWIVTALNNAFNNVGYDSQTWRISPYLEKFYEVGLIDSDGKVATLTTVGTTWHLNYLNNGLEPLRLVLLGKDNEITSQNIEDFINLYWAIEENNINASDYIIPDMPTMPDNNGTGEVDATDGKYVAPYISGTEYEADHSFELYDPDNTTWYTTADAKVSFYHATNPGAITAEDIGECTAAEAKQWIINNWDDVMHVWEQTHFVFYNGSKLCSLYFFAPYEETEASVRNKYVSEDYDVSYLPNSENLWVCTPSAGYVVSMGIERPANFNYEYNNYTYAYPKVYVHVRLNKLPAEGETVSVDFNMYSGGNTTSIKLNGASSAQPYSQTITWTSEDTEREKVFEIYAEYSIYPHKHKQWGGEMGVVVNVSNPKNAKLSGGVTSWTHTEVFVDDGGSELTTDIHTRITDVSVPAGSYYAGQVVPVTVTFHDYVKGTTGTKLTVNGVECTLLGNNTIFDSLTFGYTVRDVDGGALDITDLTGVIDAAGNPVTLEDPIGVRQFGLAQGVIIISDIKQGSFDWDNAKYGIDDVLGNQTVTIVIPFAPEGDKTWIINDAIEINPGITISVPGYENAKASYYLKSFYFSLDGGETRYPVFVLGDDDAEAFAVRLAVPYNDSAYLRKDTLYLYYDKDLNTTTDYLGAWEDRQTDANGFAYFTDNGTAADLLAARSISYYVNGYLAFDRDATTKRSQYNEANVSNGFYKQGTLYVAMQDKEYNKQHDVEIAVNEALYNAALTGIREAEANAPLVLNYRISNRATFTFADPKYFTWSTSDELVATVTKNNETGAGEVVLNGDGGPVTITLTVGNGSDSRKYDVTFDFTVIAGVAPFMNMPELSKERTTLTETEVDVLFASNLTACNTAAGVDETTFTAKLYKVDAVNDAPAGEPIWTASFVSTIANRVTHITVPGAKLATAGIYAAVVDASYMGGEVYGIATEAEDFAVTAYIIVKNAP
ncbi:MAG: hypothetical protein IK037_04325, partial [Clostridia bacterium]|nr:hypothetical protein [Clostridia bacterium]